MRTLAIGDLHGCRFQLDKLLDALAPTPDDTLVFLGDYVDRGPDSKGVVDRLIELKAERRCVFLRGNHELMMSRARGRPVEHRRWLEYGGAQTLGSYSEVAGRSGTLDDVSEAHWQFFDDCLDYFETDSHIFAHAGVAPGLPMNEQEELRLFWEALHEPIEHISGKTLICGHTSQKEGAILDQGTSICIDTFAYGGGNLTALEVHSLDFWQADILGRVTTGRLERP